MHLFIQNVDSKDIQFTRPSYTVAQHFHLGLEPWAASYSPEVLNGFGRYSGASHTAPVRDLRCPRHGRPGQAKPGRSLRSEPTARAPRTAPSGAESQPAAAGPRAVPTLGHGTPFRATPFRSAPPREKAARGPAVPAAEAEAVTWRRRMCVLRPAPALPRRRPPGRVDGAARPPLPAQPPLCRRPPWRMWARA